MYICSPQSYRIKPLFAHLLIRSILWDTKRKMLYRNQITTLHAPCLLQFKVTAPSLSESSVWKMPISFDDLYMAAYAGRLLCSTAHVLSRWWSGKERSRPSFLPSADLLTLTWGMTWPPITKARMDEMSRHLHLGLGAMELVSEKRGWWDSHSPSLCSRVLWLSRYHTNASPPSTHTNSHTLNRDLWNSYSQH